MERQQIQKFQKSHCPLREHQAMYNREKAFSISFLLYKQSMKI
jgi:hypothetical protein